MKTRSRVLGASLLLGASAFSWRALGEPRVNDASTVRLLGPFAAQHYAPSSGMIGALMRVPPTTTAKALGVRSLGHGLGELRGTADALAAFTAAHPEISLEVAPPLHLLLDRAGVWANVRVPQLAGATGEGVLVGVADTGLDVSHPDVRDENGKSRVAWMLDYSRGPAGLHPELESAFGVSDGNGKILFGAVFNGEDIDRILAGTLDVCEKDHVASVGELPGCPPTDDVGHGTHVTTIAAASANPGSIYAGMAPKAKILSVKITRGSTAAIENDDLVRAVDFMFERGDAMGMPTVVNMSLGSDFGPHDGSSLWEEAIASHVGAAHPGHAMIAAAGNSGAVTTRPLHQSVHIASGARTRVPIRSDGGIQGAVQVWITVRGEHFPKIGLEGPDGEWIAPISNESEAGKNSTTYNAGVVYGHVSTDIPIPGGSKGAVVVWTGVWPGGIYNITFEGEGSAELYLQAQGFVATSTSFESGVREGTVNLPATHPAIIGVGCTMNRTHWKSIGDADVSLTVPVLDPAGGRLTGTTRDLIEGEICWFSSAGPTATGIQKPEIAAPGGFVVAGMSRDATPSASTSIFATQDCPSEEGKEGDNRCLQIDATHAISAGTSMSSPLVAGVVALLLQRDPTLTQDVVRALLQGGAHRFRGDAPFQDQSGPGEVDAAGALDALAQLRGSTQYLPARNASWITLSSEYVPADDSREITAIVELRTADGQKRADYFDSSRLVADVRLDGTPLSTPAIVRQGPGVFTFQVRVPPGHGTSTVTFGALFDGAPIVDPKSLLVATDAWNARYPSRAVGGCKVTPAGERSSPPTPWLLGAAIGLFVAIRRRP